MYVDGFCSLRMSSMHNMRSSRELFFPFSLKIDYDVLPSVNLRKTAWIYQRSILPTTILTIQLLLFFYFANLKKKIYIISTDWKRECEIEGDALVDLLSRYRGEGIMGSDRADTVIALVDTLDFCFGAMHCYRFHCFLCEWWQAIMWS